MSLSAAKIRFEEFAGSNRVNKYEVLYNNIVSEEELAGLRATGFVVIQGSGMCYVKHRGQRKRRNKRSVHHPSVGAVAPTSSPQSPEHLALVSRVATIRHLGGPAETIEVTVGCGSILWAAGVHVEEEGEEGKEEEEEEEDEEDEEEEEEENENAV